MKTPAPADLQRWSDEVARDRRSLAFLPLARAYRRQGLREAALQLCVRGLESYPEHIEAHSLLALLHLEGGDHQKAADEWSVVLRLEPDNFDALRGMGFWCFERDQLSRARELLERAATQRPTDATVRELLYELGTREELHRQGISRGAGASFTVDVRTTPAPPSTIPAQPASDATTGPASPQGDTAGAAQSPAGPGDAAADDVARVHEKADAAETTEVEPSTRRATTMDPTRVFDELLATGPLFGALLVDAQGLVLAGRLASADDDEATLGAVLGNAVTEAARTTSHLALGRWRGLLIETQHALLHVKPVTGDNALVIAARRDAPAGWLLRTAAHAAEQAARFVEEYA
jgi:predicted regulator of Ras-like GTPase activity (Roadblock/LC7/MglB family)